MTIAAPTRTTFTVDSVRHWWTRDLSPSDFIEWLIDLGCVEHLGGGAYVVTPLGLAWSELLNDCGRELLEVA